MAATPIAAKNVRQSEGVSGPVGLLLIGGGEHASVVADAMRAGGTALPLAGFVDDALCEGFVRRFGVPRLGTDADIYLSLGLQAILGFGGVGAGERRRAVVARLASRVVGWGTVVHPSAVVAADVALGEGSVVLAGAVLNTGATVGTHCIVNTGALIDHDVQLGDQVQVSPGVVIGGGVRIGAGAYVGLGACVRDHVAIGAGAVIGMGAVVVRDVPAGVTVMGVPAR